MFVATTKCVQFFSPSETSKVHKTLQTNFLLFKSIFLNNSSMIKKCHRKAVPLIENSNHSILSDKTNSDNPDLTENLIKWAIQNNISYFAFSKLLKVLKEYGIKSLPASSKALLQAKEDEIKVSNMPPGTYTHFGFEKNLKSLMLTLVKKNLFSKSEISVSVFIDQLPLVKLTHQGLWVILGSVEGFINNIFFIGAYCGFSKPNNSNLFLSEFVKEAKNLTKKGLEINNIIYNVKIKRLICDAPAKSFVLNIRHHVGYSSCTKCDIVGKFKSKKICFLGKSSPRKDEDFEKDEMYLNAKTCLLEIPNFGIVSNVTIDYMHLVCLGVVQKLLSIWLNNGEHWTCKNSSSDIIKSLALSYPCEFQKKPKTFKMYHQWIANDFRQFLLYYGPVVLKGNLKEDYYNHFLLLHVACRLLCTEANTENINCGRHLLNAFVENYKNLYKTEQITHNIHGLYHLADECISHGILDNFSSFPFEKFLLKLKNSLKIRRKKLVPQIILRETYDKILKRSLACLGSGSYKVSKEIKTSEDNQFKNFTHFEKLSLKNFVIIPRSNGDNYVFLKNNKIIKVTGVLKKKSKEYFIAGKEFHLVTNFHSNPYKCLKLDMFVVRDPSDIVELWPVDLIEKKGMIVPTRNEGSVMIGLLDKNF